MTDTGTATLPTALRDKLWTQLREAQRLVQEASAVLPDAMTARVLGYRDGLLEAFATATGRESDDVWNELRPTD